MNLYIYNYNNYYNRQLKKAGDSIEDYREWLYYGPTQGVNGFTPGDGVTTTQIIGTSIDLYDGKGDYLIAHNPDTKEIESRWFIIEADRTRGGQWQLILHRDLLADYYDDILSAPMFIEKATLPIESPFVFNNENITVNQIKKSETLLKDKSGCAWIVGYYNKDSGAITGTVPVNSSDIPYIDIGVDIEDWDYYKYTQLNQAGEEFKAYPNGGSYVVKAAYWENGNASSLIRYLTNINGNGETTQDTSSIEQFTNWGLYKTTKGSYNTLATAYRNYGMLDLKTYIPSVLQGEQDIATEEQTAYLIYELDGSLIRDASGRYYNVLIEETETYSKEIELDVGSNLYLALKEIALNSNFVQTTDKKGFYSYSFNAQKYKIILSEVYGLETTYNIPQSNKLITSDAPWNIFAIPYGDNLTIKGGNDVTIIEKTNSELAMATAMAIQKQETGLNIYDIQLLPYCPVKGLITDENEITVTSEKQYSLIVSGGDEPQNVGIIFNVSEAKFTSNLEYVIQEADTTIKKKLNNECDKIRLASPNFSNYFDFSAEKNGGVQFFNIDCEYKPFTPYIHINPNFGGLYGYDANDPRGLILGGDFSLSQITDQWQQFQIQQKNFLNIFDRQIQNMNVQYDVQRIQEKWAIFSGALTGAASGALTGGAGGSATGSVIGGVVGGALSLAGGIQDIKLNERLRNETIDYTQDQFGYQLGNVQALPLTISKVSAFNNNNKIFPVLEIYSCTDEEKLAFVDKVAWNGMTVGVIGKIIEYIENDWSYTLNGTTILNKGYIKGKLIRLENENFRIVNAIADELYKGVYTK